MGGRIGQTQLPNNISSQLLSVAQFTSSANQTNKLTNSSFLDANSINSKVSNSDTRQINDDKDNDDNVSSFLPWGRSPIQFGVDVALSAVVYLANYWLINRLSVMHMKNFNAKIRDSQPTEEKKKEFDGVLNKMIKYDPLNSNRYWKEFYEPTLLKGGTAHELLTQRDKSIAKLYSVIYAAPRRYIFAGLVSTVSALRAYAVNPDLPFWMGAFIFVFPLMTNTLFGWADGQYRDIGKNAVQSGLTNEAAKAIAIMGSRGRMDIAELFNFGGKVFAKSIKRADNLVTFVVAIISSVISRMTRDVIEDGFPEKELQKHKEHRNPFMRWISRQGIVQDLRKIDKKEDGPLREGFLKGYTEGENCTTYMWKGVAYKVGLKYLTDFIVFGLIGMGLLKIVHFVEDVFNPKAKSNQLVYTDTNLINSFIPDSSSGFGNKGLTALQYV